MISLIPYIGGKHRISGVVAGHLRASGCDTLVDVFGGSAAVTLNAGFTKRIYNDADGDLVNLFRVIADPATRAPLLHRLRW
ncbi:MAG: DNA adenine methylase, partial [Lentisphaerae bacterium]|nr:DNA adenine methylase [Lentisphaerota bacterium]